MCRTGTWTQVRNQACSSEFGNLDLFAPAFLTPQREGHLAGLLGRASCGLHSCSLSWRLKAAFTSPPFRAPNKAPSEPGLGCTNTHIWAAVRSKAAELPHSWPSAPDLQDKGRLWPCGGPQELGALEGTAGNSFLLLPPGTLPLTALPAEGMPFPPGGLAPIRTGEDRTKTAGR